MTAIKRNFSQWEQEIIQKLSTIRSTGSERIEDVLNSFFFTEEQGRALIIQAKTGYAVYYLSVALFGEEERQAQVAKLFEMIALIRWLAEQGLITLFRSDTGEDKLIYFLQDNFAQAKISGNSLVLNSRGDYTLEPDTIYDKNGTPLYKGFVHAKATFDMIFAATVGHCYITPALQDLNNSLAKQPPVEGEPKNTVATQPEKPTAPAVHTEDREPGDGENSAPPDSLQPRKNSILQIVLAALTMAILGVTGFLVYSKVGRIEEKIIAVEQKQAEVIKPDIVAHTDPQPAITEPDIVGDYHGIDVSHWNGNILTDIAFVDSLSFAICKATEGNTIIDQGFPSNWNLIKKNKLIGGKYHFYVVHDDPVVQAEHFCNTVGKTDPADLPLIIDIEFGSLSRKIIKSKETIQNELLQCLAKIEELSGRKPMLYTNYYFADEYLVNKKFADYPLWLAEYSNLGNIPRIPHTWLKKGCKIWQKSDRMSVRNITVDYDVFHGRKSDLRR